MGGILEQNFILFISDSGVINKGIRCRYKKLDQESVGMTQVVQELIDKIKSEGVQAAENSANEIKDKAQQEAEAIVESAKNQAQQVIMDAKEEGRKMRETTSLALKQSARDTLLSLRKRIETMLNDIIKGEVASSLESSKLGGIIEATTKAAVSAKTIDGGLEIELNPNDLEALQEGLHARLQKQVKEGIELQSSGRISKGFIISFDGGRSCFEFTDESLAEYLGSFLNTRISEIVKSSVDVKEIEA